MRNEAWNEMDRIYTKKLSEKHFWTKIADRNYGICSLVRSGTAISECWTVILGLAARTCSFKTVFSWELRDFDTPLSHISLN
jgi:hypothetical protein